MLKRPLPGRIISAADGSGVPGASVVVKGTTNGTTADVDWKVFDHIERSREQCACVFLYRVCRRRRSRCKTGLILMLPYRKTLRN